jgi:predicted transcriptional regulator
LILSKKLHLLAVVDEKAKPVRIITRRKVLEEIAPRLFH